MWSPNDNEEQLSDERRTERSEKAEQPAGVPGWVRDSLDTRLNRRDVLTTGSATVAGTLLAGCSGTDPGDSGMSPDDRRLAFQTLNEEISNRQLQVEGEIPSWLAGTLLRTGPAKWEVGDRSLNHWFDGFAMLRRFAIDDGTVTYSNKYLDSRAYNHATSEGELRYREFATDPCRGIWGRFFSLFSPPEGTDNANVNITTHAERFIAMTETPLPVEFDPETLETHGIVDYEDDLGNQETAHPHQDDGYTYNYVTEFSRGGTYKLFRMPEDEFSRDVITTISRERPAYMHSFGLTEQYVILVEFPWVVNPLDFVIRDRPFVENYRWEPERGTRFLVIDRETGEEVDAPMTDAFFAFHHVNAYEAADEIVVDIVTYDDPSIVDELFLDEIHSPDFSPDGGRLVRFRLGDTVTRETLFEGPIELPRTNYDRVNTEPYRYVYGVGNRENPPRDLFNRLVKVDVEARTTDVWEEPGTYPGEPVFVESPTAATEDDGVVLSVVLDSKDERSFMIVLDATTFEEVARAPAPHPIPGGVHGSFYDM